MRPCPACKAAIPNNAEACPECGAEAPIRKYAGPPPETGPGISGGPEERAVMQRLIAFPAIVSVIAGVGAVATWGAWGILVGLLAGVVAFALMFTLEVL